MKKVIVISRHEIYISRCEKGHSLCKIFHGMEKIYSLREHHCPTVNVVELLNHSHLISDLLQALKLESHYHSKLIQIGSEDQVLTATQAFVIAFPC